MFQSNVYIKQAIGVPGDIYSDQPLRVSTASLNSTNAANNVFGRAFTVLDVLNQPTSVEAGQPGTRPYAGILVNPKEYASFGVAGNPLAASLVLPNGAVGQFCTMGQVIVQFEISPPLSAGVVQVGDIVIFENATGKLTTMPPSTPIPTGYSYAFATVFLPISPAAASYPALSVITLTPPAVSDLEALQIGALT